MYLKILSVWVMVKAKGAKFVHQGRHITSEEFGRYLAFCIFGIRGN